MFLHISLLISAFHHFLAHDWASDLVWASDPCKTINISFAQSLSAPLRGKISHRSIDVSYLYTAENTCILTKRTFTYLSLIKVWLFCSKLIGMHSVSFLWEKGSSERHKKRQLEPDGILSDRLSIPFYSFCINYQYWTNIFLIDNFRLWSSRKKQSKAFDYYLYMDMQKRFRIDAGNRKSEGKLCLVLHWLKNTNTINICKYKCKNAIQGKISLALHWLRIQTLH